MPPDGGRLDLGQGLLPIDMTRVDFSALESAAAVRATAKELVRDQLIRTGEAAAWKAWEALRDRVRALPGMEGAIIRPNRSEAEGLGYLKEAGRELERAIVGARRRALEDRAVRELREEKARRSAG
jgi:hypothetical protein